MNQPFQTREALDTKPVEQARPALNLLIAAPRGFCAGVDRAIEIVERAIDRFGPPVYVRHEIVHNQYVVDALKAKGAVFVDELAEVAANERSDERRVGKEGVNTCESGWWAAI